MGLQPNCSKYGNYNYLGLLFCTVLLLPERRISPRPVHTVQSHGVFLPWMPLRMLRARTGSGSNRVYPQEEGDGRDEDGRSHLEKRGAIAPPYGIPSVSSKYI